MKLYLLRSPWTNPNVCSRRAVLYTGVISHNLLHKKTNHSCLCFLVDKSNKLRSNRKSQGFQRRIYQNLLLQVRDCMTKVGKLQYLYHTITTHSKDVTADCRNHCQILIERSATREGELSQIESVWGKFIWNALNIALGISSNGKHFPFLLPSRKQSHSY